MTYDIPLRQGEIHGLTTLNVSGRTKRFVDDIDRIMDAIGEAFRIDRGDLLSRSRMEHLAWPRQIGMDLAYATGMFSLHYVGERFGRRDHGTVLCAVRRVKERCETDKRSREQVERVKGLLR